MKNLNGKIVNLTPHDIRLLDKATDETLEVIPLSGTIARVAEENNQVGMLNSVQIVAKKFTSIEGLPEFEDGTYYIVSLPTAYAVKASGRRYDDLLIVNETKRTRNADGSTTIDGCYSLSILE